VVSLSLTDLYWSRLLHDFVFQRARLPEHSASNTVYTDIGKADSENVMMSSWQNTAMITIPHWTCFLPTFQLAVTSPWVGRGLVGLKCTDYPQSSPIPARGGMYADGWRLLLFAAKSQGPEVLLCNAKTAKIFARSGYQSVTCLCFELRLYMASLLGGLRQLANLLSEEFSWLKSAARKMQGMLVGEFNAGQSLWQQAEQNSR
jgi:hypothetical protein